MDRKSLIRHPFARTAKLIEIGASYNPIVPKSEGWCTTIIDHADQETLKQKYHGQPTENIEPVDYVWTDGPLDALIPANQHGTYNGVIASHVGEHLPDPIGFLLAADRILAPNGIIALALPDHRVCFDFFRPRSTTGDVLDARGRTRHRRGKIFDQMASYAARDGQAGWSYGLASDQAGEITLIGDAQAAYDYYRNISDAPDTDYIDTHGWCFTSNSFHLIIAELFQLGVIPWTVTRIERASGVEFYVWLERRRVKLADPEFVTLRTALLHETIIEAEEQILQLRPAMPSQIIEPPLQIAEPIQAIPAPVPLALAAPIKQEPTIAAIIPLYNGAKFIVRAIKSVLAQTVKPIELFIVDDGSTDNGVAVVEEFLATADLHGIDVRILRKENGGQSSARNFGVAHASGDLISLLDQDDEHYPLHNEILLEPFINPPPGAPLGWSYGNVDHADGDGNVFHCKMLNLDQHPKTSLFALLAADMFVLPSATLISREIFNKIGGFDVNLSGYEDDDFFLGVFRQNGNIFINQSVLKWCIHHSSSSYTYRMVKSRNYYCKKLLAMYPDDKERSIHYARDLILPRFYPHAIIEYQKALAEGTDPARIADTHAQLRFLLHCAETRGGVHNIMNVPKARRLRRIMDFITPDRALTAYKLRRIIRPFAKRVFL